MIKALLETSRAMLIQAAYQLTEQDFQGAQVQHKGALGRILQFIGLIVILSALPSLFAHQYVQAIIGLVVGSALAFGTRLSAKQTFRKESSLQLETTTVFSEDGFIVTSLRGESRLNWNVFVRYFSMLNIEEKFASILECNQIFFKAALGHYRASRIAKLLDFWYVPDLYRVFGHCELIEC